MPTLPELSSIRCLSCGRLLEEELAAAHHKIYELESIIRRMELQRNTKCTESMSREPSRVQELSPNLQVITTRIDDPQIRSPYSCSSLTPSGGPPPLPHDTPHADDSDDSSESATPVSGRSRRTSVFAALPAEGARRRSAQFTPRGTIVEGPDSMEWSAAVKDRDSPPNRLRPTSSITFAVPSEQAGWDGAISPIEPLTQTQPSIPAGAVVNSNMSFNDAAAGSASCDAPVEWTLVSEKEVGDKGSQCTITIRANVGTQTPPLQDSGSQGAPGSIRPTTTHVAPTPPRSALIDKEDDHRPSPFARQLFLENASHTLDLCDANSTVANTERRGLTLQRISSFPTSGHASLYEARRANKISSIASSGARNQ